MAWIGSFLSIGTGDEKSTGQSRPWRNHGNATIESSVAEREGEDVQQR